MEIVTLLSTDRVIFETEVSSKKRAFELLSGLLCQDSNDSELNPDNVFDALVSREKLGSTALGNGMAIPHARLNISEPKAALLVMEEGLKMDTPDKKPVHMLFALLVPDGESETYRPMLRDLAMAINHKDLHQQLLQYNNPGLALDYLSSLFMRRDIAA